MKAFILPFVELYSTGGPAMTRLQECPAIKTLNEILGVFPGLRRDRLVDVRPATRHTSGLAIDIFFNSHVNRPGFSGDCLS